MFFCKDDEWFVEEREREEARKKDNEVDVKGDEVSVDGVEMFKMDKVDKELFVCVYEMVLLLVIYKFFKTAIEGVFMVGIFGVSEMVWKYF